MIIRYEIFYSRGARNRKTGTVGVYSAGSPGNAYSKIIFKRQSGTKRIYRNIEDYVICSEQDIRAVFENNAYLFINGVDEISYNIFEGISLREFDGSDVVMLTPDEMVRIPNMDLEDNVCFIWLDNNTKNRFNRYKSKKLNYSFQQRADVEKQCMNDFISNIYSFPNSKLLYFYNEDPGRISAIIYALYKDNTLIDEFAKKFN